MVSRASWPVDVGKIRIPRSSPSAVGGGTGVLHLKAGFFPPSSGPPSPTPKPSLPSSQRGGRADEHQQPSPASCPWLSPPPCTGNLEQRGSRWPIFSGVLQVTGRRLWKNVYDELGGSPGSTSAATCTRRHYERYGVPRGCCTPRPSPFRGLSRCALGVRCKGGI